MRAANGNAQRKGLSDVNGLSREAIETLPAAVYMTDAEGRITFYNEAAATLWGFRPDLGDSRFCGSWKLYWPDGTPLPHDECPMAMALKQKRPIRGMEAVAERPDGTRVAFVPFPTPLFDASGALTGAVNMLVDIGERKKGELALAERDALIGLAEKVTRVGNYAVDINTGRVQLSAGCVAIHGFPEGTAEVRRDDWRAGVHPNDLARLDRLFSQAFAERWPEYKADYRIIRSGGEVRWIEARAVIAYDRNGRPERLVGVNIDVTERKRAEEHQGLLVAELDHRVKNVLASVAVIARRTSEHSGSMVDFIETLDGRIQSMADTHDLLSRNRWQNVDLADLVRRELAPYATTGNTVVEGPHVGLPAATTQTMATVLHELATNAAKYGALSTPQGRVSVRWHRSSNGGVPARLRLEWREDGGPAVTAPTPGYGTSVIRDLIPYELDGTVELEFRPYGACCIIEIAVDSDSGPFAISRADSAGAARNASVA